MLVFLHSLFYVAEFVLPTHSLCGVGHANLQAFFIPQTCATYCNIFISARLSKPHTARACYVLGVSIWGADNPACLSRAIYAAMQILFNGKHGDNKQYYAD